jgi:hypothetical protein
MLGSVAKLIFTKLRLSGRVKNNFPAFHGNHPAERDGDIVEVIFDALLSWTAPG